MFRSPRTTLRTSKRCPVDRARGMINATDHRCMSEAVLLVVGLFAVATLSWGLSHRPDWWRVRTELHGFSWFAAAVVLFFAFNWSAFSYLRGSHALWFLLSFVAFGCFSFRIHENFDSSSSGAEGVANADRSSVLGTVGHRWHRWLFGPEGQQRSAAVVHLFQSRRQSPITHIDPQYRVRGRGERRKADIAKDLISERLTPARSRPYAQTDIRKRRTTTRSEHDAL